MTNLQKIIDILKEEGYVQEDIVSVIELLTKEATFRATAQLLEFTSDSKEAVALADESGDDKNAQQKLGELFEKHTGKKVSDLMTEKLEIVAGEYLESREKNSSSTN